MDLFHGYRRLTVFNCSVLCGRTRLRSLRRILIVLVERLASYYTAHDGSLLLHDLLLAASSAGPTTVVL